jgi:pimeloyl-ACP methyl ester carboxylesterase
MRAAFAFPLDTFGRSAFLLAPIALGAILLWRFPKCRRIRPLRLLGYVVFLTVIVGGALALVAYVATAQLAAREVAIAVWFTISWRIAWELWTRTVGRLGRRWVRLGRMWKRRGRRVPLRIRLIPAGRVAMTAGLFFPLFLTMAATHRVKLKDGQDPQSIFSAPFGHIRFPTADGLTLDGWFIPETGARRTILICHGAGANKGNFIWFLAPLMNRGYNFMFFDFRAHGASDGRITTYGIREKADVVAAVDWLKHEHPDQSNVIVGLGSSQGSMALALAAADDPRINAIVLDSPFTSPRDLLHNGARWVPVVGPLVTDWLLALASLQTGTNFFSASAEHAVASLHDRPVFIVHGDEDVMMPASHSQRLYDAARGPKALWFGPGPHSNIITTAPEEYAKRLFAFLDEHLGPAPMPERPKRKRESSSAATQTTRATTTAPQG